MLKQSLYTGEAGPASVLVVDDEPFNIDLFCQELEEMGHNPVPAADGEAAMDMLAAKEVDLVLLDIMMPRMNGLQVLEALKEDGRLPNLPVIVVSAIDDIKSVARCIRLGAEDHLVKPFDPALLRARVEGTLEKKRLRDKVARQLEVTRALFGRYVPPGVAEHVLSGDGELVPVLREASVLFSDLVGFTAIAQHMTPAEVMDLLNAYFEVVIEPCRNLTRTTRTTRSPRLSRFKKNWPSAALEAIVSLHGSAFIPARLSRAMSLRASTCTTPF